jgi:hypothetical protein
MPHFLKPWWRSKRNAWFVQVDRKQVNLGPDRDAALERYHGLMRRPKAVRSASGSVLKVIDAFGRRRNLDAPPSLSLTGSGNFSHLCWLKLANVSGDSMP